MSTPLGFFPQAKALREINLVGLTILDIHLFSLGLKPSGK
jgi:hypothetical protein